MVDYILQNPNQRAMHSNKHTNKAARIRRTIKKRKQTNEKTDR